MMSRCQSSRNDKRAPQKFGVDHASLSPLQLPVSGALRRRERCPFRPPARMVDQDLERKIASLYAARGQGDAFGREVRVWRCVTADLRLFQPLAAPSLSVVPARCACLTRLTIPYLPPPGFPMSRIMTAAS